MATYPTAVKTFTTKNDGAGNVIQAEHINSIQDEVTAIEDGLLNGTAPVNSSRITAPASQITNSTVTQLNVTGGSTFADLNVTAVPASARVTNSVALNTASGSTTRLTFDTQVFVSTTGLHSTTTNPGRLTAVSSGIYLITGCVSWANNSSGLRLARILIDGSSIVAQTAGPPIGTGGATEQNVTTVYRFASSGSYAELEVLQTTGSTLSIAKTGDFSPQFAMTKLR